MIGKAAIAALLSCGLYQVSIPTLAGFLALALMCMYLLYVHWVFKKWNKDFSGHRTTRGNKYSPSNRLIPPIKTLDENKELIMNNSKLHAQFDTCELLNYVKDMAVTRKKNEVIRERAKRTMSISTGEFGSLRGSLNMVEAADELDMDHIYIPFTDFLWGYTFIGPFSVLLWKYRTIILRIRQFLWKRGLIKPMDCDYEAVCASRKIEHLGQMRSILG